MSDRKETRRAAAALAALAATVAVTGCSHSTSTVTAKQAAAVAKGSATATATAGISQSDAVTATVATLLQAGISQAEHKDWSAATTTFNDVLAVSPRNVYALYNLGLIDQTNGNVPGADDYYHQAITANGNYTPALYNLAITLENSNPAEALDLYQKIVAINPQAATAYLRMAFVYAERGDTQHAKAAQAKAIAIDPALGKYSLPAKK
jgi:tetratricopeptide (TPR) repeat protein